MIKIWRQVKDEIEIGNWLELNFPDVCPRQATQPPKCCRWSVTEYIQSSVQEAVSKLEATIQGIASAKRSEQLLSNLKDWHPPKI